MNDTKTSIEQAAERYESRSPMDKYVQFEEKGYAACLEERALPAERRVAELEAENARLRDAAIDTLRAEAEPKDTSATVYDPYAGGPMPGKSKSANT